MIITTQDFAEKSLYQISTDRFTTDELEWYIDTYEVEYLQKLLGGELYELFKDDLNLGIPVEQRFLDIFNPVYEDQGYLESPIVSYGMKDMLKGFVYFHYVRQQGTENTVTGTVKSTNELSRQAYISELSGSLSIRYNRAVESAKGIREFIIKYQDSYPEFKGLEFDYLGIGGAY